MCRVHALKSSSYSLIIIVITAHRIKSHLGSGQFGTVSSGMWKKSESDYEVDDLEEVAVKSMKKGASVEERVKFLQEAAIMGQFRHPYILRILGYMTGDPVSYNSFIYSICFPLKCSNYL